MFLVLRQAEDGAPDLIHLIPVTKRTRSAVVPGAPAEQRPRPAQGLPPQTRQITARGRSPGPGGIPWIRALLGFFGYESAH
jgi:hypothetical protein